MNDGHQPTQRRRFTDQFGPATVVIGADARISGEITSDASVNFGGTLEGDMTAGGLVRVQSTARIKGQIRAAAILVEGCVDGDIHVSGTAELRQGCRVSGSISAGGVAIADGAVFDGAVKMTRETAETRDLGYSEKRRQEPGSQQPGGGIGDPSRPSGVD